MSQNAIENTSNLPAHGPTATHEIPRMWIRPHYASFNGLRAVAVMLVFLVHFGALALPLWLIQNLWVGVDLFFVLSGFLITGILIDSLEDAHYFRNFYIRRSLRIFPLFYGFFLLLFLLKHPLRISWDRWMYFYPLYIGNLTLPFANLDRGNPTILMLEWGAHHPNMNIGHLWSLCVEEQFYLIWPAVVFLVRSRRRLMNICVAASVAILALRCVREKFAPPLMLDLGLVSWTTFCRADTLLIGAWLALWLRGKALSPSALHRLAAWLVVVPVLLLGLAASLFPEGRWDKFLHAPGYTLIALAAAGILLKALDDRSLLSRLMQRHWLSRFGAVSYGFYFFHHFGMYEATSLMGMHVIFRQHRWVLPCAAFLLSWQLAKLSFRYFETPLLRLKSRLAPQGTRIEAGAPGRRGLTERSPERLHVSEPQPSA